MYEGSNDGSGSSENVGYFSSLALGMEGKPPDSSTCEDRKASLRTTIVH